MSRPMIIVHNIIVKVIPSKYLTKEMTNRITIDQQGWYQLISFDQYQNITVMVGVDVRYIIAAHITSKKAPELVP